MADRFSRLWHAHIRGAAPVPTLLSAAALLALSPLARADDLTPSAAAASAAPSATVEVVGRSSAGPVSLTGFGDSGLARSPFQVSSTTSAQLADQGIDQLNDITRLDASVGDAYNSPGYWASVQVRGYTLDPRFNTRRNGLPISGETALSMDNVERVEILKGISGMQAGTSAPGGLVNLVTKRSHGNSTSLQWGWTEPGSLKLSADVDRRLGDQQDMGLRLNFATETLKPAQRDAQGSRYLMAVASDYRIDRDTLIEVEAELSHQSQPSVPGFSLLGNQLPPAASVDPRINLNNQSWSQAVDFDNQTASLRLTRQLGHQWRAVGEVMSQTLLTNDNIAFPFGCSAEDHYDRYCSDGSFDLYDYRSDGERRRSSVAALRLEGSAQTGEVTHALSLGVQHQRYKASFQRQAYNWAGVGTVDGLTQVPAAPELSAENTNRLERSVEWLLSDHLQWRQAGLWLGLRHSHLQRDSIQTDGSESTAYAQDLNTPWIAGSWQFTPQDMVYASWGEGVESYVVPNRPDYGSQAGQALPAVKSRQTELGIKHDSAQLTWSLAAFNLARPQVQDDGSSYTVDGIARHQGVEASADWRQGAWTLRSSAMWLKARRENSADASQNGLVPTNVAQRSARLQLGWQVPGVPKLSLQGQLAFEGQRYVLADNTLTVPSWTSVGLSTRYTFEAAGHAFTWRVGVDNLLDRRAWQESPTQYGHVYLYPLAGRTFRSSLQVNL
jgi:iron complex outermembrane receptor protein